MPDGRFWSRFFLTLAPGEDTIYWDRCPTDPATTTSQHDGESNRAGLRWFWVVLWWRGRPAVSGWAETADAAAAATTSDTLTHHPGPAALYLRALGDR